MAEICLDSNVNERNHSWVVEVDEKLKNMASIPEIELLKKIKNRKNTESSIYKVPASVLEKQRDSYMPFMVSFGPYYHGHQSCMRTQDIKELVLVYSLRRSKKTAVRCVEALSRGVQILKDQYDELDSRWQEDDDAFLKLMIYDGCFFLEILREAINLHEANYSGNNHHSDNPVCNMGISPSELMECYRHDMLLLENQLPMFLLYMLASVQTDKSLEEYVQMDEAREDLNEHLLRFIFPTAPKISIKLKHKHVPDFCKKSLLASGREHMISSGDVFAVTAPGTLLSPIRLAYVRCCNYPFKFLRNLFKTQSPTEFHVNMPSATDLEKVGIGFSTSRYRSLTDISVGGRTITLPEIYVDSTTKLMYLNIIAYEQLHQSYQDDDIIAYEQIHLSHRGVTSYIYFMCRLLQGADDVKLLKLHGIIHTELSNDAVAEIFNCIAKGNFRDPETFLEYEYDQEGRKLRELFKKMSDEWHMDLWQKYLRSPWAIISLIGAFLLFCLTAIQTVYTVFSYYNHK